MFEGMARMNEMCFEVNTLHITNITRFVLQYQR